MAQLAEKQSLDEQVADFLAKLDDMRAWIASAKPPSLSAEVRHGQDIDLDSIRLNGHRVPLWEQIAPRDEFESDVEVESLTEPNTGLATTSKEYDRKWLVAQCFTIAHRHAGLEANALLDQVIEIIASDRNGAIMASRRDYSFAKEDS
jgi:hypothetical protein